MFAQLGTTVFDGLKSFVAFSNEEESILVEHALIGRKPRLQGAGLSLRTISISLFLHQEFCIVKEEIEKLRTSKNSFEILPLLWGNGQVEGEFVIAGMSLSNQQMDSIGNALQVNVSLTLKESVVESKEDQQQQEAKKDAFAVGDKKPATKSTRVNATPCNQGVAKHMSVIQSNGAAVSDLLKGYKIGNVNNTKAITNLTAIKAETTKLVNKTNDPGQPCIYNNTSAATAGSNVQAAVKQLSDQLSVNEYASFGANASVIPGYNTNLQAKIAALKTALSSNLKGSALRQ